MDFEKRAQIIDALKLSLVLAVIALIVVALSNASMWFVSATVQPMNMMSVSGALAAGTITFVGIVHTLLLREENRRVVVKRVFLSNCIKRIRDWKSKEVESQIKSMYDEAEKSWIRELVRTKLVSTYQLYMDFTPFFLFIAAIIGWLWLPILDTKEYILLTLGAFYSGVGIFAWNIYRHIANLKQVQSVSSPRRGGGEIWIRKINGTVFPQGLKTIIAQVANAQEIVIELAFSGKITNGFFGAFLKGQRLAKWAPDAATYFADFSYPNGIQLTIDSEFDIGIIQGTRKFDDTISIVNLPLNLAFSPGKGVAPIHDKVKEIEIGVYEDPIHLPTDRPRRAKLTPINFLAERFCLDKVLLRIE